MKYVAPVARHTRGVIPGSIEDQHGKGDGAPDAVTSEEESRALLKRRHLPRVVAVCTGKSGEQSPAPLKQHRFLDTGEAGIVTSGE